MRTKTKCYIIGAAFVVFLILSVLLIVITYKPTTASAATKQSCVVMLNGTYTQTMWGGGKTDKITDAAVVTANTSLSNTHENVSMSFTSTSNKTVLNNKDYINSSTVTFTGSQSKYTLTIYDEFSSEITKGNGSVTATLQDGLYRVLMTYSHSSGGGYTMWHWEFALYCYFRIDSIAPTIMGASMSQTEMLTTNPFTLTANDGLSGVKNIYMRMPNENVFRPVDATQTTIGNGSFNGRYTFYAEDNAGNKSQYYYVNFDDTVPTLSCKKAEFGTNTSSEFTVSASDNSGNVKLFYKKDNTAWKTNGTSYTVTDADDEGIYYFYAEDEYGNRTEEKWVQFGTELAGEFVKSETDNTVYFIWDRPSWRATLDGEDYIKGTWIRDEGEHTIKLYSKVKSASYPFRIDHYYNEFLEKPTCTHGGYLRYDCVQCGDSYTDYSIEETGHYYVASTTAATCTSGGYTIYNCTRCGDSYTDNYTNPLGHNYESVYRPATCTDYGKTVFTCQVCGNGYYETDGTLPTGHNYINEIITAPTCTTDGLRRIACEKCEYSFDAVITANGHNYNIIETVTTQGTTIRHYNCTVCNHGYKQELGDQYKEITNYVEYMFEQYEAYMWWVLLASAGIWSIVIGVMIAIAHKNEDKEKAKKMLVNYVIGLVVIAIIVVACPFLIRGISVLIT